MAGQVRIRAARPEDVGDIHKIHSYYVLNTVLTFSFVPSTRDELQSDIETSNPRYPYLVAVLPLPPNEDNETTEDHVVGYARAHPYRGKKPGYAPTAEISIFLSPDSVGQGIGKKLLSALLDAIRGAAVSGHDVVPGTSGKQEQSATTEHGEQAPALSPLQADTTLSERKVGGEAATHELKPASRIHQLIAIVAVEHENIKAESLRRFYEQFGFEQVGLLRRVGWKMGMWVDTRLMQLDI